MRLCLTLITTPVLSLSLSFFSSVLDTLLTPLTICLIIAVVMISSVLSDQVLYSWEGKDIERKVIVITSNLPEDIDSTIQKSLMVRQ